MKKRTVILAASVVVILALLATVFFLLARNTGSSTGAEEPPANTTVETPVKEPEVDPPAEGSKSEMPDGEPEPGETPPVEDPAGNSDVETPSVNENGKIPIASPSLLTDETTGKGIISLGDSIEQVRETLLMYEPTTGSSPEIIDESDGGLFFGETRYKFDAEGRLLSYVSWCGKGGSFETSRGLKMGDPLSKIFELYGRDYIREIKRPWLLPSYTFNYGGTFVYILVGNDSGGIPAEDDESAFVGGIGCGRELPL